MRQFRSSQTHVSRALALTLLVLLLAAVLPAACFATPPGSPTSEASGHTPSRDAMPHSGPVLCEHTPLALETTAAQQQVNLALAFDEVPELGAGQLLEPASAVEIDTLPPPPSIVLGISNLRV